MGKKKSRIVVGLDIGSQSIKSCCGMIDNLGRKKILDTTEVRTKGVRGGLIYDLPSVISSLESCLHDVEHKIDNPINLVYVSVNGRYVSPSTHAAYIDIKNSDSQIARRDLTKIRSLARTVSLPYDRQLLHLVPVDFEIDGTRGINNPLGMYGARLGMHVCVISAERNHVQNLVQAIHGAGVEIQELIFSCLSAADIVLTNQDKQDGVILVNVGAQTIQVAFFKNGYLYDFDVIESGSSVLTRSVSDGFSISTNIAEDLKIRYGGCTSKTKITDENLIVRTETGQKYFSRKRLCEIIDNDAKQIIKLLHEKIVERKYYREANAGIVFIGGGCLLEGLLEMGEEVIGMQSRMGLLNREIKSDIQMDTIDIKFLVSLGLVKYGFDCYDVRKQSQSGYFGKITNAVKEFYLEYF